MPKQNPLNVSIVFDIIEEVKIIMDFKKYHFFGHELNANSSNKNYKIFSAYLADDMLLNIGMKVSLWGFVQQDGVKAHG